MAAEATQHSAITIEAKALNNAYKCGVRHQLKGIKQLLRDANGILNIEDVKAKGR